MNDIRLYFEPKQGVCVNHSPMFKHYADNYLSDFVFKFAGHVNMNLMDKVESNLEPVYQYITEELSHTVNDVIRYIGDNPMEGYHIHVYYHDRGNNKNPEKVYSS